MALKRRRGSTGPVGTPLTVEQSAAAIKALLDLFGSEGAKEFREHRLRPYAANYTMAADALIQARDQLLSEDPGPYFSLEIVHKNLVPCIKKVLASHTPPLTLAKRRGDSLYCVALKPQMASSASVRTVTATGVPEPGAAQPSSEPAIIAALPPATCSVSDALRRDISSLDVPADVLADTWTVLGPKYFPYWMTLRGRLVRNPIWPLLEEPVRARLIEDHDPNGPAAPSVWHVDLFLLRHDDQLAHGMVYTYQSEDWGYLFPFRRRITKESPTERGTKNAEKLANYISVPTSDITVTPLDMFAVSVKPRPVSRSALRGGSFPYKDVVLYVFNFCSASFRKVPKGYPHHLQRVSHGGHAGKSKWFYMQKLRRDPQARLMNGDVLDAISDMFPVELNGLPLSFSPQTRG